MTLEELADGAVSLVASADGVTRAQMRDGLGISESKLRAVLKLATGRIEYVQMSSNCVKWFCATKAGKIREKQRRLANRNEIKRKRRWSAKRSAEKRKAELAAHQGRELPDRPQRTVSPVGVPLPFVCTAPNSVFALGQQS